MDLVAPKEVGFSAERLARIGQWMRGYVDRGQLAGASVMVGRRGRLAYADAAGLADRDDGAPFTLDTVARIYSMTKPITNVAAMMLYERGVFQLDDPISAYLPEFADMRVWAGGAHPVDETVPAEAPITVRQIMTHTSGLTYGFMNANPVDEAYRTQRLDASSYRDGLAAWSRAVAEVPLIAQPGSEWNYSVSTDVLGRLVEVWSGRTLGEFFAEEIFAPLGMTDTGFSAPAEAASRFASLYVPEGGGDLGSVGRARQDDGPRGGLQLQEKGPESRLLRPPRSESGGGGLVGAIGDYARFCQMLLNGGALEGARLLSPTTVAYMATNQLPNDADMAAMGQPVWSETSYHGIGFGLGFAVVLDPVKAHIIASPGEYHWGGAASTAFWLDPVEDLFAVFFTQLLPSSTYPLRRELRVAVNQALVD